MAGAPVRIEGLAELRRSLNKVDKTLSKNLRREFVSIGRRVAADARASVPVRTGRARASIRAGMSGNTAYVAGGKKSVPYYGWLDFGSRQPLSGRPRRVGPWKGTGRGPRDGRFIRPAVEKNRAMIDRAARAAMEQAKREAFQ